MKLTNYIEKSLNEGRSEEATYQYAEDFIKRHCKKALKGTKIFRGVASYYADYLIIRPSLSEPRKSPYADHNYYNLLLSNLPSWKKYPPRNKSISCTTDWDNAKERSLDSYSEGGDNVYYVLAKDGSKIGECPSDDIWYSFEVLRDVGAFNLNRFNLMLNDFIEINYGRKSSMETNYKVFLKVCMNLDKKRDNNLLDIALESWNYNVRNLFKGYVNGNTPLIKYLDHLLDPENNGFKLKKAGDKFHQEREVWTDGDCLLVAESSEIGALIANGEL